jgi:hypothetical protein
VFPHDGTTYDALLAEADHRMYRDKEGRRRLSFPQPAGGTFVASPPTGQSPEPDSDIAPLAHRLA